MNELEHRFHREMVQIYERAKRETGYNATRFLQMVSSQGGRATARTLLHAPAASDGFTALWERSRLELSVEALVLRPEFADLFDDDERDLASYRLTEYGYRLDDQQWRTCAGGR